jgi:hypothetical protein
LEEPLDQLRAHSQLLLPKRNQVYNHLQSGSTRSYIVEVIIVDHKRLSEEGIGIFHIVNKSVDPKKTYI